MSGKWIAGWPDEDQIEYASKAYALDSYTDSELGRAIAADDIESGFLRPIVTGSAPVVRWANEIGSSSRRPGAPRLSAESPRERLLRWLRWCDPNGVYLDDDSIAEFGVTVTLAEAWELIAGMYRER